MALILFIMVILSEAFVSGLESFRQLKALGDLEERLRGAAAELRRDLAADHFEGRRRLSDPNFWNVPVREGFFRIVQRTPVTTVASNAPGYYQEGQDDVGNLSYHATDHYLHFSVKLRGNQLDKFFSTTLAPTPETQALLQASAATTFFNQPPDGRFQDGTNVYTSPWAEVAYFLVRDPANASAGASVPLYSLYRTQLLVTPDNRKLNWKLPDANVFGNPISTSNTAAVSAFKPLSCQPENLTRTPVNLYFNNPSDLAQPFADMTNPPARRKRPRRGVYDLFNPDVTRSTLLLTDVISFQVQILPVGGTSSAGSQTQDFTDLRNAGFAAGDFDTGNLQYIGGATNANQAAPDVAAIQITLRVWDPKTEQARQITIVQDT